MPPSPSPEAHGLVTGLGLVLWGGSIALVYGETLYNEVTALMQALEEDTD